MVRISLRLVVLLVAGICALAADLFYQGTWKIDSAKVGPWWTDSKKPDPAEMKSLVGKTFIISTTGITGPRQVVCKGPKYKVVDYPADMLFQGAFDEMRRRDKSADPAKLAATLGFKGSSWKTLETGCGNEVDFHFLDPSTAAFGLNNYVYILKKQ
ncbi:MAG TPA: hypothetical protein VGV35_02335 [Bryobacteraceae bacterium]|nr:hypothetical protein [Bryobacteraceae bacterium]